MLDLYDLEQSEAGPAGTVIAFNLGTLHRGTAVTKPMPHVGSNAVHFADLETEAPSQSRVLRPGRNRTYDLHICLSAVT
jgi:hypothetical protein